MVYGNFHGAYVEPKVKREYSRIILKVMKFEQCFNVYTDEIEFDYMLTISWIEKIKYKTMNNKITDELKGYSKSYLEITVGGSGQRKFKTEYPIYKVSTLLEVAKLWP